MTGSVVWRCCYTILINTDLAPTESKRVRKMKKRMMEKLEFEQALYSVEADGNELRPIL